MPDDLGESSVIAALFRRRPPAEDATGSVLVDIGDDAAVLSAGRTLTTDLLVEGVHFDERLSPADVDWKAVAANVSDLGAMGARPEWALLGLSLPEPLDMAWVHDFASGLAEALAHWELRLVGGDTTRSPGPRVVSVTVGGTTHEPVTRAGARIGDDLWVSGTLGAAAAGFGRGAGEARWLRRPEPPVALGIALADARLAHAMMDLSDGLATDHPRLCAASGVGARIDAASLPIDPTALQGPTPLREAVAWGEDYQLLFAAHPENRGAIEAVGLRLGVALHRVGEVTEAPACRLEPGPWPAAAFRHFAETPPCG